MRSAMHGTPLAALRVALVESSRDHHRVAMI
jgi:hypothetical protein